MLGFVVLVAASYGAWQGYAWFQLNSFTMRILPVKQVNLVALDPKAGYRIIVANQIAQVVERKAGDDLKSGVSDDQLNSETDESARRLPVKDLLMSLQGNNEALSNLVMNLNKLDPNNLPPDPVIWTEENLEKAFRGDATLRSQLEKDLNVKLDGTPLDEIRPSALEIGIVVDFPVKLIVGGQEREARVKVDYQPKFTKDVMRRVEDRSTITDDTIRGTYVDEAKKILAGQMAKENVIGSIRANYTPMRKDDLRAAPQRVLGAISVVLNSDQMQSAAMEPYEASNGQRFYNLRVGLNDEGMKRLWKYSRENHGFQVLLTVDGIPVAAPRFRSELISHEVVINQLTDARLAQDTIDAINHNRK